MRSEVYDRLLLPATTDSRAPGRLVERRIMDVELRARNRTHVNTEAVGKAINTKEGQQASKRVSTYHRQTDVPATVRAESGTESRFSLLADARTGRHSNMDAACLAGNPDIRVPETVKRDDGLRAARVGEEGDAERHGGATKGGPEETGGCPTSREPRKPVVQERIESREDPEERELRHIPGGTWLNQVDVRMMVIRFVQQFH
ncbi:hypothetical protein NDU88_005039 [Pleurodeles waltl]|uniref:Uncharacterized protein n=1 Tax=Pleurodeles waltl TaxID=8319 RepID=A0AAV7RMN4_PLEWA|nr:hypothetical protein NDU88_005039 [Pleurodeles waltl]